MSTLYVPGYKQNACTRDSKVKSNGIIAWMCKCQSFQVFSHMSHCAGQSLSKNLKRSIMEQKSAALVAACEAMGVRCIWRAWLTGPVYGWEAGNPLKHCQVMATLKPCSPANSYCLLDMGQHTFKSQRETDCCHWIHHATSTLLYTR